VSLCDDLPSTCCSTSCHCVQYKMCLNCPASLYAAYMTMQLEQQPSLGRLLCCCWGSAAAPDATTAVGFRQLATSPSRHKSLALTAAKLVGLTRLSASQAASGSGIYTYEQCQC
jgi:hypothetical protein